MTEKRSKYDTDPLDPDFVKRTEDLWGATGGAARETGHQQPQPQPIADEPTRRFDEQEPASYPSVFVPPVYQPPPHQPQQPFTTFGAGPHEPHNVAASAPPPPGPSSPYLAGAGPSSRPVAKLGIGENIATVLPYAPFFIGLVSSVVELLIVPREETRTRFHAAQGLALQLAILLGVFAFGIIEAITGSDIGGNLFRLASFIFLIVSMLRVWKGRPHHIAPLDEATRVLEERIKPVN